MTTVVDALNRIARQCSIKAPSQWLTATKDAHVELRDDFLLETVDDILERVDLPSPIGKTTSLVAGAGTTIEGDWENFTLPADFKRLMRDEFALYDELQDRPVVPVSTDGQWSNLTDVGATGAVKAYRLQGYDANWTIDIYRSVGTITVHYVSDLWMASSGGTAGSAFTDAGDVLLLPRRVVESGTVWRYRERRGLPYQDKYMEYEALMSRLINDRRGRRTINMGDKPNVRWQDLVPAFIPNS